jgi:hypothetical protein
MVLHDALADPRLFLGHAGTDLDDDAARLVATDHRVIRHPEAERRRPADRPVIFQIAAAHAGGFYLQHHFARPRGRIGKIENFDPAVTGKNHTLHVHEPSSRRATAVIDDHIST